MQISSLNIANRYTYQPTSVTTLDATGKLYKADAPNPTQLGDNNGITASDVFVYSRLGLEAGKTAPVRAVVLENQDGSYFKLDLTDNDKVNLVAKGKNLDLYVYRGDTQTAEKFSFDTKGTLTARSELDVQTFSNAEIRTKRDLDGNGAIGAKLLTSGDASTAANTPGAKKAAGSIYNVNVMGQDIFVVGRNVDRLKRIDANAIALFNANGSAWQPTQNYETLRTVSTVSGNVTTWDVYATAPRAAGADYAVTTKYTFSNNNADKQYKLIATKELTGEDLVKDEAARKMDLNVDGVYGLQVTSSIDKVGGLVKGRLAGQDVVLAKVATTDSTGSRPVTTTEKLVDANGDPWALPSAASGYALNSFLKDGSTGYVFATKTTAGVTEALRFTFNYDSASKSYQLDESTAAGVAMTAREMADAEKTAARDLNGDGSFGATIASLVDRSTGLYKATMMGQDFYLAGHLDNAGTVRRTGTSGALAQNLGGVMLGRDAKAWAPGAGEALTALVDTTQGNGPKTYSAYTVEASASNKVRRYDFTRDNAGTSFTVSAETEGGLVISDPVTLAELERTTRRDLNNDAVFGATINSPILDTRVGLYRATMGSQTFYLAGNGANNALRATGLAGAQAQDLSGALYNEDGTAWSPPGSLTSTNLKSIVQGSNGVAYSIYTADASNNVLRFDFANSNGKLVATSDTRVGVSVNALEMAAIEKTAARDLNGDSRFGAVIASTVDLRGQLYTATMMGQTFFLAGPQANGTDRRTAVNGAEAQSLSGALLKADGTAWEVKSGYTAASLVRTTAANVSPASYELYAYKSTPAVDRTDVLRFDFTEDANGNFVVSEASAAGIAITPDALALREASLARDLNGDSAMGVSLDATLDRTGGLYRVSALGQSYVLAGNVTPGSANSPVDLSQALLTAEGARWTPDGVATAGAGVSRLTVLNSGTPGTFKVYVKDDTSKFSEYSFSNYRQVGNRVPLTEEAVHALEKTHGRDLSGDGFFGAEITSAPDLAAGLYRGTIGALTNGVYFKADPGLAIGSLVAGNALDASSALKDASGTGGYWAGPDSGYSVQTAFTDGTDFVLLAKHTDGSLKKYTFDTTNDNTIVAARSTDVTLPELVALETAQSRDLNRDGILAVRVDPKAADAVGGLYKASVGTAANTVVDYYVADTSAGSITDLSKALLDTTGARWSPGTHDKLTLTTNVNGGYDVYAKNGSTYTLTSFGADFKQIGSAKTLTTTELALAEADTTRDINADNVIGVRITERTNAAAGLYKARINSQDYYLLAHDSAGVADRALGVATDPKGKALFAADGTTPWAPPTGTGIAYTLTGASYNLDANGQVESKFVFATRVDSSGTTYRRFAFDANNAFLKEETLTEAQRAQSAMAASPTYTDVDTRGATDLFKATVLGQDYYVVGTAGANPVPNLSKALFSTNGTPWAPSGTDKIGGLVDNTGSGGTYDVYTYSVSGGAVTGVQKSSWDAAMNYMGVSTVDAATLVGVENTVGLDLSGNGAVGFKLSAVDATAKYRGVTGATAIDSTTYWLVGSDLTNGAITNPLGLDKALLQADGTSAWAPDANAYVKYVDDRTGADATRYVYTVKSAAGAADEVKRYEFDKTSGRLQGNAVSVSLLELARLEQAGSVDMNGDNVVGAVTVSAYRDAANDPSPSFGTDLLTVSFGGKNWLVVNDAPSGDGKVSLAGVLLDQTGTPWSLPASFTLKGVYQPDTPQSGLTAAPLQLFGVDSTTGAIRQYQFAPNVDANGARTGGYTLMSAKVAEDNGASNATYGRNTVTAADLAKVETTNQLDLNGDGGVGYVVNTSPIVSEDSGSASVGWSLGKAEIRNTVTPATVQASVYVVSGDLAAVSSISGSTDTTTSNTAGGSALYATNGTDYWSPDAAYSHVKSIQRDGGNIVVWGANSASTPTRYQQYVFTPNADGKWALGTSALLDVDVDSDGAPDAVSSATLMSQELSATRDLNGDGAVGLVISSRVTTSETTLSMYKATFDSNNYYILGTDATVATGTAANPADPATLNTLKDGGVAWTPGTGVTVSSWRVATDSDKLTDPNAAYVAVLSAGGPAMFDASYNKL